MSGVPSLPAARQRGSLARAGRRVDSQPLPPRGSATAAEEVVVDGGGWEDGQDRRAGGISMSLYPIAVPQQRNLKVKNHHLWSKIQELSTQISKGGIQLSTQVKELSTMDSRSEI